MSEDFGGCLLLTGFGEAPLCGDALVTSDLGEQCDLGADNSDTQADACRTDCTLPSCGDEVKDSGELCDDGNHLSGDGCSDDCQHIEVCGNGVVDANELCDDSGDPLGGCSDDCLKVQSCGDGVLDDNEGCDTVNTCVNQNCDFTTCTCQ